MPSRALTSLLPFLSPAFLLAAATEALEVLDKVMTDHNREARKEEYEGKENDRKGDREGAKQKDEEMARMEREGRGLIGDIQHLQSLLPPSPQPPSPKTHPATPPSTSTSTSPTPPSTSPPITTDPLSPRRARARRVQGRERLRRGAVVRENTLGESDGDGDGDGDGECEREGALIPEKRAANK